MEDKIFKIIEELKKDCFANKDLTNLTARSVVCCALLTKGGKIYKGINVAWWHSACAEVVALGNGFRAGEREFEYLISVKLNKRNGQFEIVTPCGICREMFDEFNLRNLKVVLLDKKNKIKYITINKLLPYSN